MRWPLLSSPLFAAAGVKRVWAELRATLPDARERFGFCATWAKVVLAAPGIPWRMGFRGRLAAAEKFERGAAAGRDVCDAIGDPGLLHRGSHVLHTHRAALQEFVQSAGEGFLVAASAATRAALA